MIWSIIKSYRIINKKYKIRIMHLNKNYRNNNQSFTFEYFYKKIGDKSRSSKN